MPELIKNCIESQKAFCNKNGYEYELITLDTCYTGSKYIQDALNSKHRDGIKYCKASDYLRFYYLREGMGVYVDSDVSFPQNSIGFDDLLNQQLFVGEEGCETIPGTIVLGTAVIGSVANHPLICKLLEVMEDNFSGADDLNYQSSMDLLNIYGVDYQSLMCICSPDMFYPYRHRDDSWHITSNTRCVHHFNRAWVETKKSLPTISFILPHLGDTERRKSGLEKCLTSIKELNYPQELIDIHIIEGEGTVPEKVKKGVEQSKGDFICYCANDMVFDKDCVLNAINLSRDTNRALVAFNEGHLLPDLGNVCTHFLIRRDFLDKLEDSLIFHTDFKHASVDNYLWAQTKKLDEAVWCQDCRIEHDHFSKGAVCDSIYEKGWQYLARDREVLREKMERLNCVQL